ncbi:hypothetical protein HID58_095214 [Brassica napus]|uniref:Uncharacterized protein n=1 Tax=Brassica napus TaxID=3708 RepID=A0ABQ7X4F1_BRANA|nr:hypothetical protein HID58_095214 [Brassica napus]
MLMAHTGNDEVMASQCASAWLRSISDFGFSTHTLRVDKCVPVPALKGKLLPLLGLLQNNNA